MKGLRGTVLACCCLILCLLPLPCSGKTSYALSNLILLELVPARSYGPGDCILGNCSTDSVTNIFLVDLVDGGGPCFLADNLNTRNFQVNDILDVVDSGSEDTLDLNIPALFDLIFNNPDCTTTLSNYFDDLGCLIASEYDTRDFRQIIVRIVEAGDDETGTRQLDTGCIPPRGTCLDARPRTIVNIIIDSFCGSECAQETTNRCYFGIPAPADRNLDWLIYRYEAQNAKARIKGLLSLLNSTRTDLVAVKNLTIPAAVRGQGIEDIRDFLYSCLPSWEEAYLTNASLPQLLANVHI